jgi:hypothetical protein
VGQEPVWTPPVEQLQEARTLDLSSSGLSEHYRKSNSLEPRERRLSSANREVALRLHPNTLSNRAGLLDRAQVRRTIADAHPILSKRHVQYSRRSKECSRRHVW